MFTVSYGAPPQLQLNAYEQPLVRKGNLKNLPSGSPLSDHENFGDFTKLFCSGGPRNVNSSTTHLLSYCSLDLSLTHALPLALRLA